MVSLSGRAFYRLGVGVAFAAAFVQVWMNLAVGIVGSEDNPQNQGFFGVVVSAAACAFVARLRADGMARAMLATAGVQAVLAAAIATAPSTAREEPTGALGVLILSGCFTTLWLISAALFQLSARRSPPILPGTGRGTVRSMVEGSHRRRGRVRAAAPPSPSSPKRTRAARWSPRSSESPTRSSG